MAFHPSWKLEAFFLGQLGSGWFGTAFREGSKGDSVPESRLLGMPGLMFNRSGASKVVYT